MVGHIRYKKILHDDVMRRVRGCNFIEFIYRLSLWVTLVSSTYVKECEDSTAESQKPYDINCRYFKKEQVCCVGTLCVFCPNQEW